MKIKILTTALLTFFLVAGTAFASDSLKLIGIPELKELLKNKETVAVLDANRDDTRKKEGIIPGAILLSSFDEYAASELPADKSKTLVFYCANTKCMASHTAAEHAKEFGYKNVSVFSPGIQGWTKGGETSEKIAE